MDWLWIILRYLFPNDPARMAAEAARSGVTMLVKAVFCEEGLAALEHASERIYIEGMVRDYEATLHLAIAVRACQIAGVRFTPAVRPLHFPTRAMSLPALLKRIHALVALCDDIERLAHLRAARLKWMRDADPLGLVAHGSTDAWLRHAAHHEAVGVATTICIQIGLILSSTRSVRPSKDEAALTAVSTAKSRAPPIFDVYANQTTRLAGFTCEAATRSAGHRFELLRIIQRKTVATAARANQVQTKATRANKQVAASPPYAHL